MSTEDAHYLVAETFPACPLSQNPSSLLKKGLEKEQWYGVMDTLISEEASAFL